MRSSFQADKVGISYNRRKPISHKGALLRLLSSTAGAPPKKKNTLRRISAEGKILKPKA